MTKVSYYNACSRVTPELNLTHQLAGATRELLHSRRGVGIIEYHACRRVWVKHIREIPDETSSNLWVEQALIRYRFSAHHAKYIMEPTKWHITLFVHYYYCCVPRL